MAWHLVILHVTPPPDTQFHAMFKCASWLLGKSPLRMGAVKKIMACKACGAVVCCPRWFYCQLLQ